MTARDGQASGSLRTVRLVIEFDGLVQRFGRPVPDAAGLLERIVEIQAQAGPPHRVLDVTLARFGTDDISGFRADIETLGVDVTVRALAADVATLRDAGDLAASPDRSAGVMLLAGRPRGALNAIAAGIPAYLASDRPPAKHWHLALHEVSRVIAEAVHVPVPRTVPDSDRRGSLIAVPEDGPQAARSRGTRILRLDQRADWVSLGGTQLFYVENEQSLAALLALPGAQRLASDVGQASMGVATNSARRSDAAFTAGPHSLVLSAQGDDLRWGYARRQRFGASSSLPVGPEAKLPSLSREMAKLTAEPPAPAVDVGLVGETDGEPLRCLGLPYGTATNDRLVALLLMDRGLYGGDLDLFVERLRGALGGDAVLACWSEAIPNEALWESERNRLRAIVRLKTAGEPAIVRVVTATEPRVPNVTVSTASATTDWSTLAEIVAARLQ